MESRKAFGDFLERLAELAMKSLSRDPNPFKFWDGEVTCHYVNDSVVRTGWNIREEIIAQDEVTTDDNLIATIEVRDNKYNVQIYVPDIWDGENEETFYHLVEHEFIHIGLMETEGVMTSRGYDVIEEKVRTRPNFRKYINDPDSETRVLLKHLLQGLE